MTGEQAGVDGGATAYGVSDEVWREIAVEGGRAAAQERHALIRAAGLVAAFMVGTSALFWGGILTPRLDGGTSSGGSSDAKAQTSTLGFELHNQGLLSEEVDHFESTMPGLEVVRSAPDGLIVARRSVQHVELTLHATDCAYWFLPPGGRSSNAGLAQGWWWSWTGPGGWPAPPSHLHRGCPTWQCSPAASSPPRRSRRADPK